MEQFCFQKVGVKAGDQAGKWKGEKAMIIREAS